MNKHFLFVREKAYETRPCMSRASCPHVSWSQNNTGRKPWSPVSMF